MISTSSEEDEYEISEPTDWIKSSPSTIWRDRSSRMRAISTITAPHDLSDRAIITATNHLASPNHVRRGIAEYEHWSALTPKGSDPSVIDASKLDKMSGVGKVSDQKTPRLGASCYNNITSTNGGNEGQFSVSFEGASDSFPTGMRPSPVGSSCWSSEPRASSDIVSLVSSSTTNSLSARTSLGSNQLYGGPLTGSSFGQARRISQHQQKHLQRQHSGTGQSNEVPGPPSTTHSAPSWLDNGLDGGSVARVTIGGESSYHHHHREDARKHTSSRTTPAESIDSSHAKLPPSLVVSNPEEEDHRKRLEIYMFAARCAAYPILTTIHQGSNRRYLKVTKAYLATLKERFEIGVDQIIEGLTKENTISAWKIKFDQICRGGERPCPVAMKLAVPQPEAVNPSKDQLYDLLMRTLGVDKYEHQIIYNSCQLDNADEQAAQIRRELCERLLLVDRMAKERTYPKLGHKKMEQQFIDEERLAISDLMRRLDAIPADKPASAAAAISHGSSSSLLARQCRRFGRRRRRKRSRLIGQSSDWQSDGEAAVSDTRPHHHRSTLSVNEQQSPSRFTRSSAALGGGGIARDCVRLTFTVEVIVHRLRHTRQFSTLKPIYWTLELDGTGERKRTDAVELAKPIWETNADFTTSQPLPTVKLKLFKECSGPLVLEDKEVGKVIVLPRWNASRGPEWYRIQTYKQGIGQVDVELTVLMHRPSNCKYANYCWIQGRSVFKKWRRRYVCLTQVSQYTFILACYVEQKGQPLEFIALDGFTVDYCDPVPELVNSGDSQSLTGPLHHTLSSTTINTSLSSRLKLTSLVKQSIAQTKSTTNLLRNQDAGPNRHHQRSTTPSGQFNDEVGRFWFKLVREGETIIASSTSDVDRQCWVQAIYRATGQTHKPLMDAKSSSLAKTSAGETDNILQPVSIESLASKTPHSIDQIDLFAELQVRSLEYRLQDPYVSLGWPSPAQKALLDEYTARYGIRECQRHLLVLASLLDKAERGLEIDPDLFHMSYSQCANHVSGQTRHDQSVHTVLASEIEQFHCIKQRLTTLLERQITEFRYCFPFGRPEGALEKTIGLLERVLTKDTGEPASADIIRGVIQMCLRNAAVLNYERISEYAAIEAYAGLHCNDMNQNDRKLSEMIHLAHLCIEVLKQNEEHYSESFTWFSDLFVAHAEDFWSIYQMDLFDLLDQLSTYNWEVFELFQLLNNHLLDNSNLVNGRFHQSLTNRFAPLVDRYIECMSTSIEEFLIVGYENETWQPSYKDASDQPVKANGEVGKPTIDSALQPLTTILRNPSVSLPPQTQTGLLSAATRSSSLRGASQQPPSTQQTPRSSKPRLSLVKKLTLMASPTNSQHQQARRPSSELEVTSSSLDRPSLIIGLSSKASLTNSRACQTVVDLLKRLHQLKLFASSLNWPQPTKAAYLAAQVRVLCAEMLREAVKRTLVELDTAIRKCSRNTDLLFPIECCTMLNSVTELRCHLFSLCRDGGGEEEEEEEISQSVVDANLGPSNTDDSPPRVTTTTPNQTASTLHTETEAFFENIQRNMLVIVIDQFLTVLVTVLQRLTRFDDNKLISSILSFTKHTNEEGQAYTAYLNNNLHRLSQNLVDEVALISLCESWYTRQMRLIYEWLVHRKSMNLHPYQIKCLSTIVKKVFSNFELQGLSKNILDTIAYQTVTQRLRFEEANQGAKHDSSGSSSSKRKLLDSVSPSGWLSNSLLGRN